MKKILLVDDDSNYIWLLKNFLQRKGYEVITACSVEDASHIIEENRRLRNATSRINTAFFVTYKQITPHRIWYN